VARTGQEDRVDVVVPDDPVEMRVDEVEARCGAPMPQQSRLHVVGNQVTLQKCVVQQVDLPNGQVVRGAPPGVDVVEFGRAQNR
jgi:hypothetical protein